MNTVKCRPMKKKSLPDSLKKHRMLHDGKISEEDLVSTGERYFEAGRFLDAADFFRKADFQEGMERLRPIALEQGDSFLYQTMLQKSPDRAKTEEWEALGNRAMELKKFSHAVRAFRASENEAARKKAEEELEKLCS